MNTGLQSPSRPSQEYFQQNIKGAENSYGLNQLSRIQNVLKKQQNDMNRGVGSNKNSQYFKALSQRNFEKIERTSNLMADSDDDLSSSSDSLRSQLGSKYRQLLIRNVTQSIKNQNKTAHTMIQNMPDNQVLLLKFKKLRKDNKRMKKSIKELKLLMKNKDTLINERKKETIRMELKQDKLTEEIDTLTSEKEMLTAELLDLRSNTDDLNSIFEFEKVKKHEKK
jgi:hypothetical protein